MGMTIVEKVLARGAGQEAVRVGDIVWVTPDLTVGHDLNYPRYREMMRNAGIDRVANAGRMVLTIDHLPYGDGEGVAAVHGMMRREAKTQGIGHFFDLGRHGISHNVPVDQGLVRPGMLVITSDTRSPALGCVGCVGIAVGTSFLTVMATGRAWLRVPPTLRVVLSGRLRPGTMSRDAGEWIANRIGADRGDYRAIEFSGDALAHLGIDERHTLCNAMVDIGVKAAVVLPDAVTRAYVESHGGAFEPVLPDADARYEETFHIDLGAIEPQVSLPPDPENIAPVGTVAGRRIDQAFVGSCIGGKLEDLRAAAAVLKGRKVHPDVRFIVIPATQAIYQRAVGEGLIDILSAAGSYIAVGACGPCYGSLAPLADGEVCIGTSTRNEPGRMGSHKATVMIASAATVAASAVRGAVADPREFLGAFQGEAVE